MKSFNVILMLSSLSVSPVIAAGCYTIDDAAKKGLIKFLIKSKGGYTGNVIEIKIQNLTAEKLDLKMEAGRRLDSKKENEQDILVTKAQEFYVSAKQEKSFNIFGMCCQAHNSSPTQGNKYSIGNMASEKLVKLAKYIDEHKYWENSTAQEAVWAVSDNNSIGSIYDMDSSIQNGLKRYVSNITGRPIPKYNVTYAEENGGVAARVTKIDGVFDYTVNAYGHITIAIYDASGKLVQTLMVDYPHEAGDCKLFYTFNTRNLPAGTYYTRMSNNGMVEKEMKIEF